MKTDLTSLDPVVRILVFELDAPATKPQTPSKWKLAVWTVIAIAVIGLARFLTE